MTPDQIARRCADTMWPDDHAARGLGIEIVAVGAGTATLRMTVRQDMVNGHGTCHGGFIYLLADTAFGYACNSRNQRMVAQHCSISYLKAAQRGDRLTAQAVERQRAGRSGIYDVAVKLEDGTVIAEFRGHARAIEGTLLPDPQ